MTNDNIKRLKSSGIYFRLLERYLGAKAVEIMRTGVRIEQGRANF